MIGNDIVDLGLAQKASDWKRKGYLTKIFTPLEQKLIEESKDSFKMLWRLWSMKESGYKLYLQSGGKPFYNPTKIECRLCSISDGSIQIGSFRAETRTKATASYLYSNAKLNFQASYQERVFSIEQKNHKEISNHCHMEILRLVSQHMAKDLETLELKKAISGAPYILDQGQVLPVSISLSHHGGYALITYHAEKA